MMRHEPSFLFFGLLLALSCNGERPGKPAPAVKTEKFTVSGIEVTLICNDDRLLAVNSRVKEIINSAFPEMLKLFGGLPKDMQGADYKAFQVTLHYGPYPEADTRANFIDVVTNEKLAANPVFGYGTTELTLIHEMLHFWNGHTFRNVSGKEQWFSEGATEYYAFKIAIKLGHIVREDIPTKLGLALGYYLSESGSGQLSMSEAGDRGLKAQHYFLVYCGGLTASLVLDYEIRASTGNSKSLDDLMKTMYLKFNRTDKTYTTAAILAEVNKLAGKDYSQFFTRHIQGAEIIPVGKYLNLADLHFYYMNSPRFDAKSQRGMIMRDMFYLDQK